VYGGNIPQSSNFHCLSGLSPCVRGKPNFQPFFTTGCGSIPVCTGETFWRLLQWVLLRVYPRVYGGNEPVVYQVFNVLGLSPCVRGKHLPLGFGGVRNRSIPVCTGETHPQSPPFQPCRVYPRVYGGNNGQGFHAARKLGLSPCVRGKLSVLRPLHPPLGSIPVCTGETRSSAQHPLISRVYPRVYGGNFMIPSDFQTQIGLSPCVRGKLWVFNNQIEFIRSIPVCTGETNSRCVDRDLFWVYPRVYGGNP